MYTSSFRNQFKRDFKRCGKRGLKLKELEKIMRFILEGEVLPPKCKPHPLTGSYVDCMECHIKPDWLLVYIVDEEAKHVDFIRTGTHSDLFE